VTIEQAVAAALAADSGIVAKVSTRIYFAGPPQKTMKPYLVHHPVSLPRMRAGNAVLAFSRPRWEIACWALSAEEALELARLVRDLFEGYLGVLGGAGGVTVKSIVYEDSRLYQDLSSDLWNCPVELFITHEE
jgi:hypothetical protein